MAFARYNNSEQQLKRTILDWLARQRECVPLMYQAMRGGKQADGSWKAYSSIYMPKGVADVLACWRGRFLAIEVKRPAGEQRLLPGIGGKPQARGKLSPEQEAFLARIRRARGIAIVAYSLDDVINALKAEEKSHESGSTGSPGAPSGADPRAGVHQPPEG